tara:strand:- start:3551 stop:3688 length:138 start_codon:yes stop_codon:yes gene_type:complete
MSLIKQTVSHWLFVDIYGLVISVDAEKYPTLFSATMRAFNKSRRQ